MTTQITLALPSKGAIAEPTINFLRDSGLKVEKPNQRQYIGLMPAIPTINVLFQRVADILYKVADGTAHIGITGFDIVQEHPNDDVLVIHPKLGFGHCSLVVAVPEAWVDAETIADIFEISLDFRDEKRRNMRIATKYPFLARQFLHQHGIHHFTLVKAEGAIEAAPNLGYADIIIDLTQTGTTLRENHLKIIEDGIIVDSQACLIGNRRLLTGNLEALDSVRVLLEYIDAAQQGRGYFQIISNVQGENPQTIARLVEQNPVTRGLQGPTVAPIVSDSNEGSWHTVTIMVHNHHLLSAVEHLRSIGGTQTIVTPARYVFLEESPTFARLRETIK